MHSFIIWTSFQNMPFFTARIRKMTGGYIFSLSTLVGAGGGTSISHLGGGYPISGLGGGYPHPRVQVGGYPIPGLGRGVSLPGPGGGVPHLKSGGTPSQVWMVGGYPGYPP